MHTWGTPGAHLGHISGTPRAQSTPGAQPPAPGAHLREMPETVHRQITELPDWYLNTHYIKVQLCKYNFEVTSILNITSKFGYLASRMSRADIQILTIMPVILAFDK